MSVTAQSFGSLLALRTFAFNLPRKTREVKAFQVAARHFPNLQCMQIFVTSEATRDRPMNFIEVLPELPKVVSLKVCTGAHAMCLPTKCIQHIRCLELGESVSFKQPGAPLHKVVMQSFCTSQQGFQTLVCGLLQVQHCLHIEINSGNLEALLRLPGDVHTLECHEQLFAMIWGSSRQSKYMNMALSSFAKLQVLCIAEYLTRDVVQNLSFVVLPQVHTFGITIRDATLSAVEYCRTDSVTGLLRVSAATCNS